MRSAIALGFLLLMTNTASAADLKKLDEIAPGDTRARVIEIMGKPGNRQFSGNREALQWCKSGVFSNHYGLVVLHDGKVFSIHTASTQDQGGTCSQGFPPIDWVINPDKAIEVINR